MRVLVVLVVLLGLVAFVVREVAEGAGVLAAAERVRVDNGGGALLESRVDHLKYDDLRIKASLTKIMFHIEGPPYPNLFKYLNSIQVSIITCHCGNTVHALL